MAEAALRRAAVVRQGVSVGIATGAYGVSFGALAVAAGLSVWQTQVLSLLLFSGGSQFAFVGIIVAGPAAGAAAVATSTLLGVRNGLYGLQLTRLLATTGLRRVLAAHLTIDESTAVAVSQRDPADSRLGFWVTGVSVFVLWNLMTLVGAVLGGTVGDPREYGLDAAAAAAFVGLLWPRLRALDAVAVAVAAGAVAVVLLPRVPAGVPVLVAALAALLVLVTPGRRPPSPAAPTAGPAGPHSPADGPGTP